PRDLFSEFQVGLFGRGNGCIRSGGRAFEYGPASGGRHVINRLAVFAFRSGLRLATAGRQERAQSAEAVGNDDAVSDEIGQRFLDLAAQQFRVVDDVGKERSATF